MRFGENTMSIVHCRAKVGTGPRTGQLNAIEGPMEYSAPILPCGMSCSKRHTRVSIWQSRCWRALIGAHHRGYFKDEDRIVINDFPRSETVSGTNVAPR